MDTPPSLSKYLNIKWIMRIRIPQACCYLKLIPVHVYASVTRNGGHPVKLTLD